MTSEWDDSTDPEIVALRARAEKAEARGDQWMRDCEQAEDRLIEFLAAHAALSEKCERLRVVAEWVDAAKADDTIGSIKVYDDTMQRCLGYLKEVARAVLAPAPTPEKK
jgi:hypothetical protein